MHWKIDLYHVPVVPLAGQLHIGTCVTGFENHLAVDFDRGSLTPVRMPYLHLEIDWCVGLPLQLRARLLGELRHLCERHSLPQADGGWNEEVNEQRVCAFEVNG